MPGTVPVTHMAIEANFILQIRPTSRIILELEPIYRPTSIVNNMKHAHVSLFELYAALTIEAQRFMKFSSLHGTFIC